MRGRLIDQDLVTMHSIVDPYSVAGQRIHGFLESRAKALVGRHIDFTQSPVTFVLSDTDEPNAFFAPVFNEKNIPQREDHETVVFTRNPFPTPVICITRGLVDLIDNRDQLDFVLGHELTHMLMRRYGIANNSKGEEEMADLHAVDLIYDEGGDPKQAMVITEKIHAYSQNQLRKAKAENKRTHRTREDLKDRGINWSEIFDVHMTDSNRTAGISASLTRLSHLIDARQPTSFDKTLFNAHYTDPVSAYLQAHGYQEKTPEEQLKLLIDCVDHIAVPAMPAADYFRTLMETPSSYDEYDPEFYMEQDRKKDIQKCIDDGYTDYFGGKVIDKKYQQKIARLTENIITQIENPNSLLSSCIYLQDQAFAHIYENGCPAKRDLNYLSAASILYSYFYHVIEVTLSDEQMRDAIVSVYSAHNRRECYEAFMKASTTQPVLEQRIKEKNGLIRTANNAETFLQINNELDALHTAMNFIQHAAGRSADKEDTLENLSAFEGHSYDYLRPNTAVYRDTVTTPLPWDNLIAIAQENEDARNRVIELLDRNGIVDFRLLYNAPYVRLGNGHYYIITPHDGHLTGVPKYQVDYITQHSLVLQAYDYVRSYFEGEETLISTKCDEVAHITRADFFARAPNNTNFDDYSLAAKCVYDLIFLFNTLPSTHNDVENAASLIPLNHHKAQPMPGRETDYSGRAYYSYADELLHFDNPIFQEHFGPDYKERVLHAKQTARERVFDSILNALDNIADIFLTLKTEKETLESQVNAARDALHASEKAENDTQEEQEVFYQLCRQQRVQNNAYDTSETLLYNLLFGIFSRQGNWSLKALNQEQKDQLARYVVNDKKDVFLSLFGHERYAYFYNHLRILDTQCQHVTSGDYKLTEDMQWIADHHGYQPAANKDALYAFFQSADKSEYRSDTAKCTWYLHIFDTMRYLEQSADINIHQLAMAITQIQQPSDAANNGPYEVVESARASYEDLMQNSNLLPLAARAINYTDNYRDLSFDALIETAEALITMRSVIKRATTDKKEFLESVDKTIVQILIQTEQQALGNPCPLTKCAQLYALYHPSGSYYDRDKSRSSYLSDMLNDEPRLKNLSTLSDAPDFWPEDALEHVKAFIYAKSTFLDGKEVSDTLLSKVEALPPGKKKNQCLFLLLDKKLRGLYPETRERVFAIFINNVLTQLGQDDGSDQYKKRLAIYLKALSPAENDDNHTRRKAIEKAEDFVSGAMAPADKYILLRRLSDAVLSQEQTSELIKEHTQIKLGSKEMLKSYLYGIGIDYVTAEMDQDSDMAKRVLSFLNSKGGRDDCDDISRYIKSRVGTRDLTARHTASIIEHTQPENCKILYENFWGAPLEARAVMIARILKSASNPSIHHDHSDEDLNEGFDQDVSSSSSWEKVFHIAMDTLIAPDDHSIESAYARDIMHSYIKARSSYERELIMSAMMVANRNIGNEHGNIGKALKLFLENMGPAEIKLGQAIASHPNTPTHIQSELQGLKSTADIPARWTLYDWIKAKNIPQALWKDKYLGDVLGSASYYTTVALGDDKVLRILRHEAREKAAKGFRVIHDTIGDLKEKSTSSALAYDELTASVQEMVTQAAKMSAVETDHTLGHRQLGHAKDIYDDVTITSDGITFSFHVMDWCAKGADWIVMDRANGLTFNALPMDTPEQIAYKRSFAKAYIAFEVRNILSGQKFDHDRHGAQLSIDPHTHTVSIYDTGAMALQDPTPADQRHLGQVMYSVIKASLKGQDPFNAFTSTITEAIDTLHHNDLDTAYLVEVKKGLLALGDFFAVLTPEDVTEILPSLDFAKDLSPDVQQGLTHAMSFAEKAQYHAFIALHTGRSANAARISQKKRMTPRHREAFIPTDTTPANTPLKSSWLDNAFATDERPNKTTAKPSFAAPGTPGYHMHAHVA
ncbi:MAG: M48 family metalloprotease [Pseudomonadota bacterium]